MTKLAVIGFFLASMSNPNLTRFVSGEDSRRHLLEDDSECVLYLKDIQYEDGTGDEMWVCEFTHEQSMRFGGQDIMEIQGISNEMIESHGVVSGEAVLKTKGAFVDQPLSTYGVCNMIVPEEASVSIEVMSNNDPRHQGQRRRKLADSIGTLRTLVVRVIDSNSAEPTANAAQLRSDIFEDDVCLKSQYADCSKDQLIIESASDVGDDGIVNVNINVPASQGPTAIENAARTRTAQLYGGNGGLSSNFDLVMFCQPPGSGNWLAFAYINRWDSFYNDIWCQMVSAQMHEVGHNLGLAHSGQGNDEYGDTTSTMGYSFRSDDGPVFCFNAAKNYQLGWYTQQQRSVNPLDYVSNPEEFVMNGVEEYKKDGSSNGELITLRLEQFGSNGGLDYYVGYNRKVGANRGTVEAADQVVVFSKATGGPSGFGQSRRVADLSAGQSYKIPNFRNSGIEVEIKVESISADLKDATITISADDPNAPPVQAPVSSPTRPPTRSPTRAPVQSPVPPPTSSPIRPPTRPPTRSPTRSPVQAPTPISGACGGDTERQFQLELRTDDYGSETYWYLSKILPDFSAVEPASYQGANYADNTLYLLPSTNDFYCLDLGRCYLLGVYDTFGDGMSTSPDAGYRGFLDGEQIFEGDGNFEENNGLADYQVFCVGEGMGPETPAPSSELTSSMTDPGEMDEPSSAPSTLPSASPTVTCTDSTTFRFKDKPNKTCKKFLRGKNLNKLQKKCKRKWKGERVYDWCPETCGRKVGLGQCSYLQNKN